MKRLLCQVFRNVRTISSDNKGKNSFFCFVLFSLICTFAVGMYVTENP